MSTAPFVDTVTLRDAGREPAMPCRIALTEGRELELLRALRVLPGKRVVAEARLDGAPMLAKLFIADGAERHLRRERDGIQALLAAGIETPEIIAETALPGGGQLLATRFLPDAVSLAERWAVSPRPPGDTEAITLIRPALALLARMHAAGLAQSDLHLGNFLLDGDRLLVIDGDAVERHDRPLTPQQATDNLAILLAQLPATWDAYAPALLKAYAAPCDGDGLSAAIRRVRDWRCRDLLKKSVRNCSLFAVSQTATRFSSVRRELADALRSLTADPDRAIALGDLLKNGNSATVARVNVSGQQVVIKRYNLKSPAHALSRLLRPSRAWHSWHAAIRLCFAGVATPRPLALVEERWGPLRRRAWLMTAHCSGAHLGQLLCANEEPPAAIAEGIIKTFTALREARITHGDLKATNLLWDGNELQMIDLDATACHSTSGRFSDAWQRDRSRLLRNWPENSVLVDWLDRNLPQV